MSDQTPDLAALEALAEAANLGPLETRLGKHCDLIEVSGPFALKLGNLDHAKPEQAELIAQAPAAVLWLIREVERLTRWKAEALPVIGGLQELGSALGLPLGERITGPAALEAVERLTARATKAETEVERLRGLQEMLDGIRTSARTDRFRCCECCETEHLAEGREDDDLIDNHTIACNICQDPERMRAEKAEETIGRARELADLWAGSRSDLGPVARACGALLRAALDGGEPDA